MVRNFSENDRITEKYRFSIMIMADRCVENHDCDASSILDFFDYPMNGAPTAHNSAEIYGRAIVYGILQPPVYGKARVSSYFGVWIQRKQA